MPTFLYTKPDSDKVYKHEGECNCVHRVPSNSPARVQSKRKNESPGLEKNYFSYNPPWEFHNNVETSTITSSI